MRVLIVGGSGGVGQDLLKELNNRDLKYDIVFTSRKELNLEDGYPTIEKFIKDTDPDVVVNLACISRDSLLKDIKNEDAVKQIDVNVYGNLALMQAFTNHCKDSKKPGKYIYISSILSSRPVAGAGIYSATKAFNDHIIQVAAMENARYGITFNSIQLGYFGAGLCERLSPELQEAVIKQIPLRRWGNPGELVNLLEYFIHTEYATGSVVKLSGGL